MTVPEGAVIAAIVTVAGGLATILLKWLLDRRGELQRQAVEAQRQAEERRRQADEEQRRHEEEPASRLKHERLQSIGAAREFFNGLIRAWIDGAAFRPDHRPDERILGKADVYEEYLAAVVSWLKHPEINETMKTRLLALHDHIKVALDKQERGADHDLVLAELTPAGHNLKAERDRLLLTRS